MIQEILKKLDFTDKETEIYLAILEQGKTTPAQVAAQTGINRTTVYATVKTLVKKGVIAEDLGGSVLYLVPLPFDSLYSSAEKEEKALESKKKTIAAAIDELEDMPFGNKKYSIPKIRFIEEEEMEKYLYKQLSVWYESSRQRDGVCWGFQDHSFAERYREWIAWAVKELPENRVKLITNLSEIEKAMKGERLETVRKIKYWQKKIDFTASTWVMGDYLIMLVTRQKPNYLVEIHDQVLAHNLREVFRELWQEIK